MSTTTTTTTTDNQMLVLSFYILVDASLSMEGERMDAVNQIIPEVIDAIEESPTLADIVRFGAIDFADDSHVVLRLGDVRDVQSIPKFTPRGATSYAAGFRELRKEIASDLTQLKGDGYKVHRPAVFFLTDGEPTDDLQELTQEFAALTSSSFKYRPNIIPFGVGKVQKDALEPWVFPKPGGTSKKPMRSYVYGGSGTAADAIRKVAELLISSIIASANSVADEGTEGGFQPPDEEDLDNDWI